METSMSDNGHVTANIRDGIGSLSFFHPKKNSLPGHLLRQLAHSFEQMAKNNEVAVITLSSEEEGPFCAGASFDEMLAVKDGESAREYFMGFARVILAMKSCPKFILTRVQGRVVGGGIGLIAASDYVFASSAASLRLAEFALGFGPFVIGPAVVRKTGLAPFATASIDTDWRDASWAQRHGLYSRVFDSIETLDDAFREQTQRLSRTSAEAAAELKSIFWEGTEDWEELLAARAAVSGRLVLSDFTTKAIEAFRKA